MHEVLEEVESKSGFVFVLFEAHDKVTQKSQHKQQTRSCKFISCFSLAVEKGFGIDDYAKDGGTRGSLTFM